MSTPSPTPSPTSTLVPTQTNPLLTETILIIALALSALLVFPALAFKKGYTTIEVVNHEDTGQEENQDHNI